MSNGVGEIRGKVVDKLIRRPLAFARISVKKTELNAVSDKNGEYVISQVPSGSWTLEASMSGYVSDRVENVSISVESPTLVNFSLVPIGYFDLKERIPYYMKISAVITLILLIIVFRFSPTRAPKLRERRVEAAVQTIELPPQLKQLEEPPPPPKPEMPVAAESEAEVEAETIDRTDFSGFEKAPPAPEADMIYDFNAVEEKPELLQKYYVLPEYPEIARKAGIEGQVVLELVIDTSGLVIDIKVVKSLHELLDEAAVKAAHRWRYKPARQRDKAVKVRVLQPVRFRLDE